MAINVQNMPMNKLFKFADDNYVWSVMLNETRDGNCFQEGPRKYTEVYRIDENGILIRVASGKLNENPRLNDFDKRFSIFDYDQDCDYSFFVETPLKEVNLDDLYKMRKAISRGYNREK